MKNNIQFKLIFSYVGVSILVGVLSLAIGWRLIDEAVFNEAKTRIRLDLNTAWEIYNNYENNILLALKFTSMDQDFISAIKNGEIEKLKKRLNDVTANINLDFAGIVTEKNITICRIGSHSETDGESQVGNEIVNLAIKCRKPISGTVILDNEFLINEDPYLSEKARIDIIPTNMAAPRLEKIETNCMAIAAAITIFEEYNMIGVLYGGIMLNRDFEIVDKIRDTVFQQENYKGQSIGTATIFFKDMRISTNVLNKDGKRAIGTRVSKEVKERVLDLGEPWTNRAFVVNDWYITAYEPIEDIFGERVGILYVGVLEEKYVDIRKQTLSIFILIIIAGIVAAIIIGYILGNRIFKPVKQLIDVSTSVSKGDMLSTIGPISKNEIGVLQKTFIKMLAFFKEHDRVLKAESENKLLRSEKQASIGRLAAGVAHEINNPLTGVLTFTHMLLKRNDLKDEVRADLETIANATERVRSIVKGLLDFSRQTSIKPMPNDINDLIRNTISLIENQALVKGINIHFESSKGLPQRTLDRNQIQSVLMNIIINAIDATSQGGHITITSGLSMRTGNKNQKGIEVVISDTGHGIPQENLDKLFDPFFTTKEVGEGTGLGLAVSYGIIEQHGGNIQVKSKPDNGSSFIIWLPIEDKVK